MGWACFKEPLNKLFFHLFSASPSPVLSFLCNVMEQKVDILVHWTRPLCHIEKPQANMSNSIFHGLDCKELHHLYNLLCVTAEDAWPSFWCLFFLWSWRIRSGFRFVLGTSGVKFHASVFAFYSKEIWEIFIMDYWCHHASMCVSAYAQMSSILTTLAAD